MMNTRKVSLIIGSLALLSFPLSLYAQIVPAPAATGTTGASTNSAQASPEVVKATKQLRLATVRYQSGAVNREEVNAAAIALAKAQIHFAFPSENSVTVQQALADIVKQRQQLLQSAEARYNAGATDANGLLQARITLAQASASVSLYDAVGLRKQSLSLVQTRSSNGAATSTELAGAQNAYQQAVQAFLESVDKS